MLHHAWDRLTDAHGLREGTGPGRPLTGRGSLPPAALPKSGYALSPLQPPGPLLAVWGVLRRREPPRSQKAEGSWDTQHPPARPRGLRTLDGSLLSRSWSQRKGREVLTAARREALRRPHENGTCPEDEASHPAGPRVAEWPVDGRART